MPADGALLRLKRFETTARFAAAAAVAVGLTVLIGWALDISILKSVRPHWVTMKANTALGFLLAGSALWWHLGDGVGRRAAPYAAALMVALGAATLAEYAWQADFGIDQLLFRETASAVATSHPGRMAPNTAFSFLALGLALLLMPARGQPAAVLREGLALAAGLIAVTALVGYGYNVPEVTTPAAHFTRMAVHTAAAFVLLSGGILCGRPGSGAMRLVTSEGAAGLLLRTMLPLMTLLLVLLGWLRMAGEQAGLYPSAVGTALFVTLRILVTGIVVFVAAILIARLEKERNEARQRLDRLNESLEGQVADRTRELQASEGRFRAVFEAAGDAMFLLGAGRFIDANEASLALFRSRRDELIGRSPDLLSPALQPDGGASAGRAQEMMAQAAREGHHQFDWQHLRADGAAFDAEVSLTSLRLGGQDILLAIVRDVSARKRLEEARRLNEARLEAMQRLQGMVGAPEREILHYALEEAVSLTCSEIGYVAFMSADEKVLEMQSWSDSAMAQCRVKDQPILYPVERTGLWGEAVRQRRPMVTNEYAEPSPWKKGTPAGHVPLRRHMNLPVLENGRIVIVAGVGNKAEPYDEADVRQLTLLMTGLWGLIQRKRGEESLRELTATLEHRVQERTAELAESTRRLEVVNQELEAFSYSVSHDLRAPLRHVTGFSDLLQRQYASALDERGRHYLDTIGQAARKMGQLIDDLLVFSRMGRVALCRVPVPLDALVQEAIRDLASEVKDRQVTWVIGELPVLQVDRSVLRLVFANLLGNALKYTRPRAEARIEVGHRVEGQEDVIYVRDNGVGFDMQYVGKLFGVFQRLHSEKEFEGTGIGLANVRRIVQRHGGRTWAEGRPGEGAVFFFSIAREAAGKGEVHVDAA